MPLSPQEVKELEELERTGTDSLDPSNDADYEASVRRLDSIGAALDRHYASLRKVDDAGKVTEEFPTRLAPTVGNNPAQTQYFFEPNRTEVQDFLRRNPQAMDRLGLRPWAETVQTEEIKSPVIDNNAIVGYNIIPAKTNLDLLQEDTEDPESPYSKAANEMWRLRMEEAQKNGETLKRYRDVKLDENEWPDFIAGGITKGINRVVAPALIGAANVAAGGQGAALGDAITDLADYTLARTKVNFGDPYGIGDQGLELESLAGPQPRSREVINRNPFANTVGEFGGYSLPYNPTNYVQNALAEMASGPVANVVEKGVADAGNYAAANVLRRMGAAGVSGGITNSVEGLGRDITENLNQRGVTPDDSMQDFGRAVTDSLGNVPLNMVAGAAGGAIPDAVAQGLTKARETFTGFKRNQPLKTLENAGGEASLVWGAVPPDEIKAANQQVRKDRFKPNVAPGTAEGRLSAELAPKLEESVRERAVKNNENIGKQMRNYYAHPDYRELRGSTKPAMQALVDMASVGFGESASGARVPVDAPQLKRIGGILREYAPDPIPVSGEIAPAMAHESGGILVPADVANHLFGDLLDPVKPGDYVLLNPINVDAQSLTKMEERIYRELDVSNTRGMKDDPVWKAVNEGIKKTRDESFPAYRDDDGNLVGIPPESEPRNPFQLDPGAVPPTEEMKVMGPPIPVKGETPRKPEGVLAVGPGRPDLPSSPFDPRAGKPQPSGGVQVDPRPIGVGGEGMVARPEGLYGVGPGGPPIPENPFDPRLPVSQEAIRPLTTMEVQGEYGPPPPLDPNARMGVGDRFNPEPVQGFTEEGLPIPRGVSKQPTKQVQGSYNKPPEVQMEPAPKTDRNPYGFADRGQPTPEKPLPPSERPQQGNLASAISASTDQNGLAHVADVVKAYGGDVKKAQEAILEAERKGAIELRPEGGLDRLTPEEKRLVIPGPDGMVLSNIRVIDESALKGEAPRIEPRADERGGLEKMLDAQLEKAPKASQTEIDEIGAAQTADREKVAGNWKNADELFSQGREARAKEVEKVKALAENQKVVEEALAQLNNIDRRLGPIPEEQKKKMLTDIISQKLGREITAEDLIRLGLISAGLVQASTDDSDDGAGGTLAGIGLFGLGKKKGKAPEEAPKPKRPAQYETTLPDGTKVKGLSALRAMQHDDKTAIETAMKRLGVEGDNTLEGRIRTYGQLPDREKIDQALLDEANAGGYGDELRRAAGANAYAELKDRATPGGSLKGLGNALIDFFGFRGYELAGYFAGRFDRENFRNPYVREPNSALGRIQKNVLEDPARRLLDLSRGAPAARWTDDAIRAYRGDVQHMTVDEDKKRKKQKQASP